METSAPNLLRPAPRAPWNAPISAERRFGWAEFPFGEFRRAKSVLGGTVNDAVLTVIAGGMGRYLRALGQPTDGVEIRAMFPVSMRRPDERGALGRLRPSVAGDGRPPRRGRQRRRVAALL